MVIQDGTRLSAIFELLKANEPLREVYTRNWAQAYLERYEAIRRGDIAPEQRSDGKLAEREKKTTPIEQIEKLEKR